LNRPTIRDAVTVQSKNPAVPVATMVKRWAGPAYLFAVGMRDGATEATFTLAGMKGDDTLEVLDENRTIAATNGSFSDYFEPWAVHLYKLSPSSTTHRL
jgi:hypothetical protein